MPDKVAKEGKEYHNNYIEVLKEELKEGYEFSPLEVVSIPVEEQTEGFSIKILISFGGPEYAWFIKIESQKIQDIKAMYRDWYVAWIPVTRINDKPFMKKMSKKVLPANLFT